MPEKIDRSSPYHQEPRYRIELLQTVNEQNGGTGSVVEFLERGARYTDNYLDKDKRKSDEMTEAELELWISLHETGLTATPLPLEIQDWETRNSL